MGSRKGIANKSSMRADLTCQMRGYSSIDAMIDASELAMKKFTAEVEGETSGRISPMESRACDYLGLYVKIACQIATFIHPKRKAVEHIVPNALEGMTPTQKLEAANAAVRMLEIQVKKNEPGSS